MARHSRVPGDDRSGRHSRALRRYESLRLPRTSRVQAASKENKTRFHLPDGALQRQRDAQIQDAATDWFLKAIGWIYEHDAGALPLGNR